MTYVQQHNKLLMSLEDTLLEALKQSDKKSKYTNEKCISLGDVYITRPPYEEIIERSGGLYFYDNGLMYALYTMSTDELCELADMVAEHYGIN